MSRPGLPDTAGLPAAVTDAEKAAMDTFLNWTGQVLDWGATGWARAGAAKSEVCP